MKPVNNPHDAIFKQSMQRPFVAKQFMQYYLPPSLVAELDLETLTMQDTTYINDQLESAFSDVVFSCNLAGQSATISLLVEHQSRPEKLMPVRVGYYMFSLFMRHIKEGASDLVAPAYCIVFYHNKKYPYSLSLSDCFNDPLGIMKDFFTCPIPLVDVSQLPDEQLRQQQLIGALAQTLKHIRDTDISELVIELYDRYVVESETNPALLAYINNLLQYAMSVGNADKAHLLNVIEHVKPSTSQLGDGVMRIADILRAEGLEKGLEQGIEKGIEQGIEKGKLETAAAMLADGLDVSQVMKFTGLSEDQISQVKPKH